EARNPAVALTISGPEGTDAHLLFARHPEFARVHGLSSTIPATLGYHHPAAAPVPPNAIGILRRPDGSMDAWLTGPEGERQTIAPLKTGQRVQHEWSGASLTITDAPAHAVRHETFEPRGAAVREEAIHVIAEDGVTTAEAWLTLEQEASLPLGHDRVVIGYRRDRRELPFSVKLLDFRKIDYPGTTMAAGFESDVELTDAGRGVMLLRTIKMNEPLRYRGYSLYQASFVAGTPEVTVLAVRNDPGTPFVYAGGAIILLGVVGLFASRRVNAAG
ncbi:MAG: cytochrome c biogenesis protein ResB, partial [Dehalococcoidia bacterium]|nr:cytochrome c biogenesis protein ResB [Dehalococcoidia bacterium]